jgi:ribosome-associated toxin RatA of RatAB toxin-antitoxin module
MPAVAATVDIPAAPIDRVWDVVYDCERYPALAEHVLEVSRRDDGHVEWLALLNGSRVGWVQQDSAQPPQVLAFEQVDGDLDQLRGRWTLLPQPSGVRLRLDIEFHLGVDGLAALLDPMWAQSFHAHAEALTRAVARACARACADAEQSGPGSRS